MPNLELVNYYGTDLVREVIKPDGIDYDEILTYFEPNIVVR